MSIRPVPLTHFQRQEMFYLIEIMLEDFEFDEGVAWGYGFANQEQVKTFLEKMTLNLNEEQFVPLNEVEAIAVVGEFANRAEIAADNSDERGDEEYVAAQQYRDGIARVVQVFGSEIDW